MTDTPAPPPRARLLVVDDEATQRQMLGSILRRAGYEVESAATGEEAFELLGREGFDLLLTDQRMPGLDGLALLERVHGLRPGLPVVLMTAYGSIQTAVAAMKRGASDYLAKPFDRDELLVVLDKVLRHVELEAENRQLRGELRERYRLGNLIGASKPMQEVYSLIERVADTAVPVLITGESGTGKELVARALHHNSSRAAGPLVALNCAAVPETLLESEFFGHEKGAFTGATQARAGRFEEAHRGTLFLDEIAAMRVDLQAKLLRAIQEREVRRLGGDASRRVDVRVVAATGEDLEELIRERAFREDLYYRLNVVSIALPPLRDRLEDLPVLAEQFLGAAARKLGRQAPALTPELLERLLAYPWPGNVRELENCIERMVVLARGPALSPEDLPPALRRAPEAEADGDARAGLRLPPAGLSLVELERDLIRQAMTRSRGSIAQAARLLGISYKTLQYRLRKFGFDREGFDASEPGSGSA